MVARDQGLSPAGNSPAPPNSVPIDPTASAGPRRLPGPGEPEQPTEIVRANGIGKLVNAAFRPRSIRGKLIRILCVSIAMVLLLLGFLITGQASTFNNARQTTRIITVTLSVEQTVHQLQSERGLTNGVLNGDTAFIAQLAAARPQTDTALNQLKQVIDQPANADAGAAQVRTALAKLDTLTGVRGAVDNGSADPTSTFQFYTNAISALNGIQLGLDQAQDGTLRHGLQALYSLADATEYTAQERGLLNGVFAANAFSTDNYTSFAQILGSKESSIAEYGNYATTTEEAALNAALSTPAGTTANNFEAIAVHGVSGALPVKVDPQTWWTSMTSVINGMRTVQLSVGHDVTVRADQLRNSSAMALAGISALALLIIGIMVALVIGAARSVIDPVRLLARDADDMSIRRLPEAVAKLQTDESGGRAQPVINLVPTDAATEITVLARALDRLQDTALGLATEQALIRRNTTASLANLGRRNQNLVRRQLALISDFEREELDPTALANMFELDHLATRMRRNAESVLVLVGQTSPRVWSQPLPVADVIRAALSEVEDYRRVVLRRVDPAFVAGSVITEVAHMVAELVENGLAFSSPELEVEIYGRQMGNRYLLVVVDHGVGMSPGELAVAQARLRDEENFMVAPTRFLGHYVVGRLANRLGVRVDLSESPVTGLTARLLLPTDLLAEETPKSMAMVGATAERETARGNGSVVSTGPTRSPRFTRDDGSARDRPSANGRSSGQDRGFSNGRGRAGDAAERTESTSIPTARSSAPAPAPQTPATPPARTPNGLVKRQSRRRIEAATATSVPPVPRPAARQNTGISPTNTMNNAADRGAERSPGQVRSMLSAFQQGHQRGQLAVSGVGNSAGDAHPTEPAREEDTGDYRA
ncbi:MAG TPA: nitrate- and nitrite sensing domain-containing protein [Pseudonocardiaceae bacterium]|nr:nitrate- and nitrite sensing domain-containing protein [Pseudonocardiaceae bacterium]